MKKNLWSVYVVLMAALVLSLSGCGGDSDSGSGTTSTATVKQVMVLDSPALQVGSEYEIYRGSTLESMDGAKFFVAEVGGSDEQAIMNLGLTEELNETFAVVDTSSNKVVFAYDPSGDGNKTSGDVSRSGGKRQKYNGLTINNFSNTFFSALTIDRTNMHVIQLNGNTAVIDNTAIASYDYVWHISPDYDGEYWTDGINGTEKLTEENVEDNISETVYIAHDIRYTPNTLQFTDTATKDGETEYAAYYSDSVQEAVASGDYKGPFILATLPSTMGMGGGTPPDGNTPPSAPNGNGTPPNRPASISATASNSDIAAFSTMTHSASEAYDNPVLHITEAGTYVLRGTWNGQIWIEAGENDKVAIILDNVDVTCNVAPALVFKKVYECRPNDEDNGISASQSRDIGLEIINNAGAVVLISDDTVNNFTGANVYRILKTDAKSSATKIDGTDIDDQKKMYKMDGAFYSFMSMAIGGGTKANGKLNITSSTYEGLDAELHMTIESGNITVSAPDDGINVNEDNVSIFTMLDGTLTIESENGDGIDSNGYVVITGGTLNITAGNQSQNSAGEAGIDAEKGVYIASGVTYNYSPYSGNSESQNQSQNQNQNQQTDTSIVINESIDTYLGTTTITVGKGVSPRIDTDTSSRTVPVSGTTFILEREVNTFSGIASE